MLFSNLPQSLHAKGLMRKILVIEDEALVRANILEILEAGGEFDAIGAENGKIGVRLAKEHLPDLILCDIMMPELDGYGVLNELKTDAATAAIPFIFLTARADKTDLRQGMNLGADDYLTKPFRRTELLGVVATRLEKQLAVQHQYKTQQMQLMASVQQLEERLNYLIHYDSLTNLPNQQLLQQRLQQLLLQAYHHQQQVPILSLDLDRFNRINETLGHAVGDQLLKAVANRLIQCVGGEASTIARLNGDQFVIVLAPGKDNWAAAESAQLILNALSQCFVLNGHEIFITACIGISVYPDNGPDLSMLLQHADAALSHAQEQGGNHFQFYTPQINDYFSKTLALEASLHYALERSEFQVYYQPQVDFKTGLISGAEALLRWDHPEWGFVSPAEFIPLAEQSGLILQIDQWVLESVCTQLAEWKSRGLPPLRIAVNLSGRQFHHSNLCENVVRILTKTGINPSYLDLELTERIIVQRVEENITTLKQLKALGIQISIDDFGTGYSSLNYLKQFPFDTLKIDRCFVSNIASDSKNAAITKAMIQMAHSLNLKVIAEGVETEAELAFLKQSECDEMQGYLFSRPLPKSEFENLLVSGKCLKAYN
ncbi:putative bifunctional diguanylate cyclase/phosphodiesterase [Microcoleus sp. FACHB-672]|uniref:putative bifunctional diguanylate cyclase/phosphodiesterase n=1 Tax=Microcoleus sp. FACHB-672 TaxID=2692825 RepID=UPI001F550951|nr:GGDEF domain-containing response regulator [Microcoleus sp. FACHB-672]